jgi:hypothetical protein
MAGGFDPDEWRHDAAARFAEYERDLDVVVRAVQASYGSLHGGITLDPGGHPAAAKILRHFPDPKDWPPNADLRCPCGWTGAAPAYLGVHLPDQAKAE